MKERTAVVAAIPERNQSFPDDDVLSSSQEPSQGSHVSLPPTPPACPPSFPRRQVSSMSSRRKASNPRLFDSPKRHINSLSESLQRLGSNLPLASATQHSVSQVLVLGAVAVASCVVYPVAMNRTFSLLTGCSPALIGHLRSLGVLQHASALCSKGYNQLADLLHMSEKQYAPLLSRYSRICFGLPATVIDW